MIQHLLKGDELVDTRRAQSSFTVMTTQPMHGRIKVYDKTKNAEVYLDYEELRLGIGQGDIRLMRPGDSQRTVSGLKDPEHKHDKALSTALSFARQVTEAAKFKGISHARAYERVRADWVTSGAETPFPGRATVYRYLKRVRNGLLPLRGNQNKGNRTPRRPAAVEEVVLELLKTRYLQTESNWSIEDIADSANLVLHDERILARTDNLSSKYVGSILRRHLSTDPEIERMDSRTVAAAKSTAKERIRSAAPLLRVEQDGLHMPWRVSTPYGDSTNVWLVHAVDCFSGLPVGWHLVVGSPTVSDSLRCVQSTLFSKKERFAALGLNYKFDPYGTPSQLVIDNGPETKGDRIDRLSRIGIDPKRCKAGHPHHKPFIERLNKSLKKALQTLPGCTRFDGKDGQRDPKFLGDSNMSLLDLERWIVRWYYEEWANTELKRHAYSVFTDIAKLGITPAKRWKSMVEDHGFPLPLPPNRTKWQLIQFEEHSRTLSRKTGITFNGYMFRGSNLPYLIDKYGEERVTVLVDPEDFRRVYVQDGPEAELVELVNADVDETTPAYPFSLGNEAVGKGSKTVDETDQAAIDGFRRDKFVASTEPGKKPAKKSTKAVTQSRQTARVAKHDAAVHRAVQNPLPTVITDAEDAAGFIAFEEAPVLPVLNRNTGRQQEQ